MAVDILVPSLGESVTEAIVAGWKFQNGDAVERDAVLVELETEKVSVEVAAPESGILQIMAQEQANVAIGDVLGRVDETAKPSESVAKNRAKADTKSGAQTATAAPPPAASGKSTDSVGVTVPALGESVTEAIIAGWKFQNGDAVERDMILVELETDKVSVEIAAPESGILQITAQEQANVAVGDTIGMIAPGGAPAAKNAASASETKKPTAAASKAAASKAAGLTKAGPAARQEIREKNLNPDALPHSGLHGNILPSDIARTTAAPASMPASTIIPAANLPERTPDPRGEERIKMSRLRQSIAIRLKNAQNSAAMLTTFNEVNMTALIALRTEYKDAFEKKYNIRLGFMSFFAKAAIAALQEIPSANAEIYGDEIIYKQYYDIGIAVGSSKGLMVPILRDVNKSSFAHIETRIHDFGVRARTGKISMDEMTGGTFTITNGGVFGSLLSTPIINPPQSAILGMHQIQKRPVVIDNQIQIADMMYLALSYDHRIIDGREAVTFLVRVKQLIESPARLLLDV